MIEVTVFYEIVRDLSYDDKFRVVYPQISDGYIMDITLPVSIATGIRLTDDGLSVSGSGMSKAQHIAILLGSELFGDTNALEGVIV